MVRRASAFLVPFTLIALLAGCAGDLLPVEPSSVPAVHDLRQLEATIAVPGDYATIADALAAAVPDDVVEVAEGVWVEDLTLPGGVTLLGAGLDSTIIEGEITVVGGQAGIASLTVLGPGATASTCGITAGAGNSILAASLRVNSWWGAFCLDPGSTLSVPWPVIDRASLNANGYGVIAWSGEATVTNTYFAYSVRSGVWADDGVTTAVVNNTFIGNAFGGNTPDRDAAISLGLGGPLSVVSNNNVTSNFYGMQCAGCEAAFDHNNVWGNTTNYAGDASAESSDLSLDPLYVSVSGGNLRLEDASPLIDAGSAVHAPDHDWDGLPRPSGAGVDIGADEWTLSSYTLVINEVMANPGVEATGEYIEIHNVGNDPVDIEGLIVSDGDSEDVIEPWNSGETEIPGGGYAVVLDTGYASQYTIAGDAILVTVGNATLGNGLSTSDPISLMEDNGYVVIDEWTIPFNPGDSVSVERVDVLAGNVSSNWVISCDPSGSTPGAVNCAAGEIAPNDPSVLIITEVMANATAESTGEYVEIWNSGAADVNLSNLVIEDENLTNGNLSSDALVAFAGGDTVLPGGGYAVIVDPNYESQYLVPAGTILVTTPDSTIGNGLSNANDAVTLYDTDGVTVIDSFSWPTDPGDGISVARLDYAVGDIETNWAGSTCSIGYSAGRLNCAAGGIGDGLVINEIMNNPLNEQTGEFIELKNVGSVDIELAGLFVTDGDQVDSLMAYDGSATLLAGGAYALLVDPGFAGDYTIPAGVVTLTTTDIHLGNGMSLADPITLLESDAVSVIDTWMLPFNPGNGTSVEKVDAFAGDVADNWEAATGCAAGSSPGLDNCSSYVPIPAGTTELYLTEIMSNPLDEATGEYLEVYNYGTTPIDLWGLIVYDGDAWDFIREYQSEPTIVPPGEYALIVDQDYAGQYNSIIPSSATMVTVDDGAIGSGLATNDPVFIYEADGYSIIDSYTFPFNAGNGVSVEKFYMPYGDQEDNWVPSDCDFSPGDENCGE
jgi:hypothetical protein